MNVALTLFLRFTLLIVLSIKGVLRLSLCVWDRMAKRGHPDIEKVTEDENDVKSAGPLTDEQQRFVNLGYFRWAKIRNQWTQPSHNNQPRSTHPSNSFSATMHDDTATSHDQSSSTSTNQTNQSTNRSQSQSSQWQSQSQSFMQQSQHQYRQHSHMEDDSDSDDASNVDLRDVMQCLKTYREFAQPIRLSTMVDIVQVLWDDEEMQQTY